MREGKRIEVADALMNAYRLNQVAVSPQMLDLRAGINFCALADPAKQLQLPQGSYQPGFLTVLAAWATIQKIPYERILVPAQNRGYLNAIGLNPALGGPDSYAYDRKNAGKKYSPLTPLRDEYAVDLATTSVNGCMRQMLSAIVRDDFLAYLCRVVGELHDNVWSHGKAPGFSLAQTYKQSDGILLEFSVADAGLGFYKEMCRVGQTPKSDEDAILWCIEKGHTTKGLRVSDGWEQSLPRDAIGSPFSQGVKTRTVGNDSHHQGLGLYHLTDLVRRFSGELILASGSYVLHDSPRGRSLIALPLPWNGVAMCCRFHTARAGTRADVVEMDAETATILSSLKGMTK
jgi:hypothetical protein